MFISFYNSYQFTRFPQYLTNNIQGDLIEAREQKKECQEQEEVQKEKTENCNGHRVKQ